MKSTLVERKQWLFWVICLALYPVSIFISNFIAPYTASVLWWLAVHSGATTRTAFSFRLHFWLPFAAANGLLLSIIPLPTLKDWFFSLSGAIGRRPRKGIAGELGGRKPLLWAWVVPTLLFVLRFLLYDTGRDRSVLGQTVLTRPTRWEHFFASPDGNLLDPLLLLSISDKVWFTAPMFFTLSYAAGVLLRHAFASLQHRSPRSADTLGS